MNLQLLLLVQLSFSCLSAPIAEVNDLSAPTIKGVLDICRESGCFGKHHHHRPHNFINCSTIQFPQYGSTSCRYGYPSSLNLSHYEFVYDFNSLYVYDSSHYEGLAWAAPERVQFVYHAMKHKPQRVAVLVPITQQRWTLGIVWSLQQLGIEVESFPYNNKHLKAGNVTVDGVPWQRDSNKWIGLQRSCLSICKPCFRAMTLAAYNVTVPLDHNISMGSCKNVLAQHKANILNLPYSSIETIPTEPILHSTLRNPDYETKSTQCTHIALIVRLGNYRALVHEEYDASAPVGPRRTREQHHIRDFRMINVFQSRFGVDNVRIYFGNGTTEELLDTFGNACAIVGPGGAAFANVIFALPYTYVLEIQAYIPTLNSSKSLVVRYESNIESGLGTGVTWDMYRLGFEKLIPSLPFKNLTDTLATPLGQQQVFIHIVYESNYLFSMSDYLSMADTTCANVKHLSSSMGLC